MKTLEFIERSLKEIYSSPVDCLTEILRLILKTVECDCGGIVTYDRRNKSLEIEVIDGYTEEEARAYRGRKISVEEGVSGKALKAALEKDQPILIIEEGASPIQLRISQNIEETLSYGVPSLDEIVGVITLERKVGSVFRKLEKTPEIENLMRVCSQVTAIALAARQSFVFRFEEFLSQEEFPDIRSLVKEVTKWVYDKFKVNICAVYLMEYDQNTGVDYLLCQERIVNGESQQKARQKRYEMNESCAGLVASEEQRFFLTNLDWKMAPVNSGHRSISDRWQRDPIHEEYPGLSFKSYLGVPIFARRQVIGVLEVLDTEREYAFSDGGLLEMIARRIGLEYMRVTRETRRESLFAIPNIETRDLDLVIREVVDYAMEATAATHGLFMNKEEDGFHPEAARGYKLKDEHLSTVDLAQENILSWVMNDKKKAAYLCSDLKDEKEVGEGVLPYIEKSYLPDGFIPKETRSLLVVPAYLKDPITDKPEDLGALILMSFKPNVFRRDEMFITLLAEIVSYHIWGVKKSNELESQRLQVSQLQEAMPYYRRASTAAAASAGTVHTANKHINNVEADIQKLIEHKKVRESSELLKLTQRINKQFTELTGLYERLHDVFRGGSISVEPCDVAELVQDVRSYMEPTFRERRISFKNLIKNSELPKVEADSVLMKVVFINLINNSIDAGAREITVAAKETTFLDDLVGARPAIEVSFKDDGTGIAEGEWERMFDPFVSENKKGGSGLGLAVNRDILNQHQGKIKIDSSSPDKGTIFSIVWPTDLK